MRMMMLSVALVLSACAVDGEEGVSEHEEVSDFEIEPDDNKGDGTLPTFSANNVVADVMLTAVDALDVDDVQKFFESSPYGTRSWLASYTENGMTAAELVVQAAQAHQVNPLILISRMQVETSLVSKTTKPTTRMINRALGCGCPDGQACNSAYAGLQKQLDCGAKTFRRWYDASIVGNGIWNKGVTKSTLDPKRVTPANHATASFYAYTPWVLVGSGGCWLAWNVTRKYEKHAVAKGLMEPLE